MIGRYQMGFEIAPRGADSALSVFVHYNLPSGIEALPGFLLGHYYAKWCVRSMAAGATAFFRDLENG